MKIRISSSIILAIALVAVLLQPCMLLAQTPPREAYADRIPGVVYFQVREGYQPKWLTKTTAPSGPSADGLSRLMTRVGVHTIQEFDKTAWQDPISRKFGIDRIYVAYYSGDEDPIDVVREMLITGYVEKASPRYSFKWQYTPNDPSLNEQYTMDKFQLEKAWELSQGSATILIGNVDSGTNYDHEDLAANIYLNQGEMGNDAQGNDKKTNKVDDDGDGFVDNWRGWDASGDVTYGQMLRPDSDPIPVNPAFHGANHGTLTAGCQAAVTNNGKGIAGVAPHCKIIPIKICGSDGNISSAYEGVYAAAKMGARVISCSWGGLVDNEALPFAEIFPEVVTARGAVMVAAAGNYTLNNDINHFYPAYIEDVLAVGATDKNDNPSSFTHFGKSVDVFAPGVAVYTTTWPGNSAYDAVDGTSFACPSTAGVVALIMSKYPEWSPKYVMRQIVQTCDDVLKKSRDLYWGRVNANSALLDPGLPGLIITGYKLNNVDNGVLDKIDAPTPLVVTFKNTMAPGNNMIVDILPGGGFKSSLSQLFLGTMTTQAVKAGETIQLTRTGQFSEGAITINFRVKYKSNLGDDKIDNLALQIPLTKKEGFETKVPVAFGTGAKQLFHHGAGWTSFGVYLDADTARIRVGKYSKRQSDGTWSEPTDVGNGRRPVTAVGAIDGATAFFGTATNLSGGSPSIMRTEDGAENWDEIDVSSFTTAVRSINFFDPNNGILIGDPIGNKLGIAKTSDGGQTWTAGPNVSLASDETLSPNSIYWVGQKGWFGTNKKKVYRTTDGGAKWAANTTPLPLDEVVSIAFSTKNNEGLATFKPAGGSIINILRSVNGGFDFQNTVGVNNLTPYGAVYLPNSSTAIVATDSGLKKTTNNGTSWSYLGTPSFWSPTGAVLSAAGDGTNFTVVANSPGSGVIEYSEGISASVAGGSIPEAGVTMTALSPNPAKTVSRLSVSVTTSDDFTMSLIDAGGRVIQDLYDGHLPAGSHEFVVPVRGLASGTYTLVLRSADGRTQTKQLVVLH